MNDQTLKQKLDFHYHEFDKTKIEPDPLQFLHMFSRKEEIEIMGFLASVFAYGSIGQIISSLNRLLTDINKKPYDFVISFEPKIDFEVKHRFYTENDVHSLFIILKKIFEEYGSLKSLFIKGYDISDSNVKSGISNFSREFLSLHTKCIGKLTHGIKFMFPLPERGSACKRMNLFLRWMVRKDELDFGLWNEIPTNKLIIPVDTHIAKISRSLKLTTLKNVSWNMAEQITENLKKFDKEDPVKYDFALCHIGMRKIDF